jgi:PKHD-type hydroxylase
MKEISSYGEWMSFVSLLDDGECDHIIETCRSFESRKPEIVGEEEAPDRRQGAMFRVPRLGKTEWMYQMILEVSADANERHFGLDLTGIVKEPEYVEYYASRGHFHWHNDYGQERPVSTRKLTVSIQLSDPADYDGGQLEMFDARQSVLPVERGTVSVFPSFYYHRVRPVARGTRKALVAWIAGATLR